MGKSYYNQGGGVNYLCLPLNPQFPDNARAGQNSYTSIYGVEYQSGFSGMSDQDATCAVCEVQGRSAVLMIPARNTCPDGWTLEYEGLLGSEKSVHKGSDYVCVSSNPEPSRSGNANTNGGLIYVVEAQCGALPCPPYVSGYELTCVVCTK